MWLRHHWQAALTVIFILSLLGGLWWLRSPLHHLPLERDEGAYAVIAVRWGAGDILYRDLFDHKPPFVYLVYALAPHIAGDPVVAVRMLATGYLMFVGVAAAALTWWLYGKIAAISGVALTLVYSSSLAFQGLTFNSEAIMALPALLACLLVVVGMRRQRPGLLALGGVGVGIAIISKLVGMLLLLPLALAPLLMARPWRQRLAVLGLVLGGAALPVLGTAAMLWWQGALQAAYQALVTYNRIYTAESIALGWNPDWLWKIWVPMLPLFVAAIFGLMVARQAGLGRSADHHVVALWGLMLLITALLSLRAYPHYYLAVVPFCGMWVGAGIAWLSRYARRRALGLVLALAEVVALTALVVQPIRSLGDLSGQTPHAQSGMIYGYDGWMFFGVADTVAAYVRQHVPAGQRIFVWAAEPQIYYLAGRAPSTRFVYDYPITRLPGGLDEVLGALRANPPLLIITYRNVRPPGFDPFMSDYGYRLQVTIAGYDIYERPGRKRT